MRTPKEYSENLKNGIITAEMLEACLFSVNKRAKNCRDKIREYRRNRYFTGYEYIEKYDEKKDEYYSMKDHLLTVLKPKCIHKEEQFHKRRIYDYEKSYKKHLKKGNYIHSNYYFDHERDRYVDFIDIPEREFKYYLFYELGDHSFHTPIPFPIPDEYSRLELKEIDSLITHGLEFTELVSMQFVRKVLQLIESGDYEFKEESSNKE